jgi:hypothetical protein
MTRRGLWYKQAGSPPARPTPATEGTKKRDVDHIRAMRDQDALSFLIVRHAAVRGLAPKDYLPNVVERWAPMRITP